MNYLIARNKYQPDYFLYENNKSMSPAIREQITQKLGVEPILINSARVSAQSRWRLYWIGKSNGDGTYSQVHVEQPADLGILLRDVLDSEICWEEKTYSIDTNNHASNIAAAMQGGNPLSRKEMQYMLRQTKDGRNHFDFDYYHDAGRDKSSCVTANTHKGVPYNVLVDPIRIGTIENQARRKDFDSQQYRIYSPDGKSVTLCGQGGGVGAKTGLYAVPIEFEAANGKIYPIYTVKNGLIEVGGEWYPIKLSDGYYVIRKLTVSECKRLQTVPDTYSFPVSASQAYKMLGNGWTCDVIAHIMRHFDGIQEEPVEVLSMYDGMSCGHIALDKLGAKISKYYATEIDKYAIQTTQHNYPETIQLGDAFQIREENWKLR